MSDPTDELVKSSGLVLGGGAVSALFLKLFEGLFRRNVQNDDDRYKRLAADLKEAELTLRSVRDDVNELKTLGRVAGTDIEMLKRESRGAHTRLDRLGAPSAKGHEE